MLIKSQRDFWSALIFIAAGLSFALGALNYPFGSSARPGPGYFPLLLGLALAGLGVVTLIRSLGRDTEDGEPIGPFAWKPLVIVSASLCLFGFLLPRVGLFVTLPLLVILSSLASDEFTLPATIVSALVLTVASWAIFVLGLGLVIPLWPDFIGR